MTKCSTESIKKADEMVTVRIPEKFLGVGAFYSDFTQVSDAEAISYMKNVAKTDG